MNTPHGEPLFCSTAGVEIGSGDFTAALQALGVRSGNTLFVHANIAAFGKLIMYDRNTVLQTMLDVFTTALGKEGTLIMPTFTYSFCNKEPFDVLRSKSTVGSLTEFFRTRPDVVRTKHPIFSVALWGKNAQEFSHVGKDSFDEHSIFAHLHAARGMIVFLGVPFWTTFIHHIEELHGIPYRFIKQFHGTIIDGPTSYEDSCTYFVRPLDGDVETNLSRLEARLRERGSLREVSIGDGSIIVVDTVDMFDQGMHLLDEDIYSFLSHPPKAANAV